VGLDPARDWLPVAPAAHYTCGGILADLDGASSLPGLWVAGEAGCNGVHGANRLASNSLLDGMVFGPRVVEAVERGKDGPDATGAMRALLAPEASEIGSVPLAMPKLPTASGEGSAADDPRNVLQRAMTENAGVLRSAESLAVALDAARTAGGAARRDGVAGQELLNLATVGAALSAGATAREETRGAHARSDFPALSERLRARFVLHGEAAITR
jgi:L-aspartate oxidase